MVTWRSSDKTTENQIDDILSERQRGSLLDISSKIGADVGIDHPLIVGMTRKKLTRINAPNISIKKSTTQSASKHQKKIQRNSKRTEPIDIIIDRFRYHHTYKHHKVIHSLYKKATFSILHNERGRQKHLRITMDTHGPPH